jgi:hypothetical protein
MITIDTLEPRRLSDWWAERLGGETIFDGEGHFSIISVPGWSVNLGFQKVEDPTPGKNRIHLDLDWAQGEERESGIAAWVEAGATHLGQRGENDFHWDTFTDPEGNEFCIGDAH